MSDHLITAIVSVLIAIVGVAAIATLLSRSADTSGVLTAGSGAFSSALCTALSPVTGGGKGGGLLSGLLPGNFNPLGCSTNVSSTITFGS